MAALRGTAAFKKRDGALVLAKDAKYLSWTPSSPAGAKPEVTLTIASITNLQQTPPDKPKVMLKIFAQPSAAIEPITHTFSFTSPTQARAEADAIRDALSKAIQAFKTDGSGSTAPGGGSSSAAMAIASTVSSGPSGEDDALYDDDRLISNIELQQSLLKANSALSRTFMESLRTKPDSISSSQFTSQFWSSRFDILRAHAIERSQRKGAYNVLSTLKSRTEDNVSKLNITREQINLIFSQHSLVKQVYDENVPRLSEEAFWSRFFQSRLLKKLKGERITEADQKDAILDKYLSMDDDAELERRIMASHVPHIIDLAGNEENHSQRKGNAPDLWMRPTSLHRVPIIRTLNSLSEKLMSQVAPNDADPSAPIGMDEETFNSLALRDLQGDPKENQVILNVKDQSRFFSSGKENDADNAGFKFTSRDIHGALDPEVSSLQHLQLSSAIGLDDESSDSDSDVESNHPSKHVGSKSGLRRASQQILAAIAQQRIQNEDPSSTDTPTGLPPTIVDRMTLTHATTTEFLHHFWLAFLSGDPARATEIARLVETLDRAMDRIKAVATDAEAERLKEVDAAKKRVREHYERTKKKLPFEPDAIGGGRKAIERLMKPTVEAIRVATTKYAEALALAEAKEREGGG